MTFVWFTGIDVPRYSFLEGAYMLRFDPAGADLSFLNNGAPILDNHTYDGAEGQKGVVLKAWTQGKNYLGTLKFSRRPDVDGLWQDIQDRIVQKFSMGVEILKMTEQRDKAGKLQLRTATAWRPYELSVAALAADWGTNTLSRLNLAPVIPAFVVANSLRQLEIDIARLR